MIIVVVIIVKMVKLKLLIYIGINFDEIGIEKDLVIFLE